MDEKTARRYLKLELASTFPKTPRHEAIRLAINAVDGLETARKDSETVDKLSDEYFSQMKLYAREMEQGDIAGLVERRTIIDILGRILGFTKKEIEEGLGIS